MNPFVYHASMMVNSFFSLELLPFSVRRTNQNFAFNTEEPTETFFVNKKQKMDADSFQVSQHNSLASELSETLFRISDGSLLIEEWKMELIDPLRKTNP